LKRSFPFTFILTLLMAGCLPMKMMAGEAQLNWMPIPAQFGLTGAKFRLAADFRLSYTGFGGDRLCRAATRTLRRLSGRTGLFFPQDYITVADRDKTAPFIVDAKRIGELVLNENESYELTITAAEIVLKAETDIGALRGFETLLQLLSVDEEGYYFPTIEIRDQPRYAWRGLMIDVSRHFLPVEVIKRNLDGMAAVKLNVFHWHLVDDQGFRIESKTFPELHEMGSDGFYFSQAQVQEIIAYAAERGIRVIPEFDIPAHATSWFVGRPELASAPGPYTVERNWGILNPTMDPTKESTYEFLDKFLGEMAALFPDEYLHVGGDENKGTQWNENPDIQKFMKANNIPDNHTLQMYFNRRVLDILTRHGKKMIGWDEIFHPDLPKNIVVHSWRGHEALDQAAQQGYMGILSNGYYIDLIQPAEFHYLNDPIPADSKLSDEQKKMILGGEVTSWAELITPETVDSRIWPRTAAVAERFWSPQSVRDVDDMYRRLETVSYHLEELDLTHLKNYDMMLRRLTNNQDIEALGTLLSVVEPVKIYQRHFQGVKYTSYSPYTRCVDAARPESMTARRFTKMLNELVETGNMNNIAAIGADLQLWRANHAKLVKIIALSPILGEMESLSADLAAISEIGLKALDYAQKGKKAPAKWVTESLEACKKAKAPRGQTELRIVEPIEKLLQSVNK